MVCGASHRSLLLPWLIRRRCSRLDLRPEHDRREDAEDEAPPLGVEGGRPGDTPVASRRRTRFLDLTNLRHASVEQRIEGLRRYRDEHSRGPSAGQEDESHSHGGPTDRLRERFHIRTGEAHREQSS